MRGIRPSRFEGRSRLRLSTARRSQLAALAAVVIAGVGAIAGAGVEARSAFSSRGWAPPAPIVTADTFKAIRAIKDSGATIRILPLGDSITQGHPVHRSYRYYLWNQMIDAGVNFDFVGSMNSSSGFNPYRPPDSGKEFDHDHEGRPTWTLDHMLYGHPKHMEQKTLSEWLNAYTPDIALTHLGTNDMIASESAWSADGRLRQIIKTLRDDNPNVIILLARLIPVTPPPVNDRIDELNERIDVIAMEMNSAASPVIVVDLSSGFNASTDTYDGLHPNDIGDRKMADKWFEALKLVLGI